MARKVADDPVVLADERRRAAARSRAEQTVECVRRAAEAFGRNRYVDPADCPDCGRDSCEGGCR